MPELPDITVYVETIAARVEGQTLERVRFASPFLLRTAVPPISDAFGRRVAGVRRIGKRVVLCLENELFLVIHLMVSGRFRWEKAGAKIPGRVGLAAFDFAPGSLILTEASTRKRASLHVIAGEEALRAVDPGGIDPMSADIAQFRAALSRENHTLKRALTDPRILSGIGNSYSDEILHAARLSPVRQTKQLTDDEWARLHRAAQDILRLWTDKLRKEAESGFPEKVTAFREDMAVHGKYKQPCPVCGDPVQRIVYADNETNYCPTCQTGGRLLADRALSRLLHGDWPRTLEELEERKVERRRD